MPEDEDEDEDEYQEQGNTQGVSESYHRNKVISAVETPDGIRTEESEDQMEFEN